jgi:hypothetical protein
MPAVVGRTQPESLGLEIGNAFLDILVTGFLESYIKGLNNRISGSE